MVAKITVFLGCRSDRDGLSSRGSINPVNTSNGLLFKGNFKGSNRFLLGESSGDCRQCLARANFAWTLGLECVIA